MVNIRCAVDGKPNGQLSEGTNERHTPHLVIMRG
jgi:hypothetical protein